jgi:hypothetical protein
MSCDPLIIDGFEFPKRIVNAAGLPRIACRIGRYPDFVEAMLRAIDAAPELAAWTHRHPDDPGIALIEGAAILGDILSFYQEHYANEAYLRTAAWRESVAELVRLTGYRLAPGLGGRASFGFEARGSTPVTIRAGFPVKAQPQDAAAPADFQTDAELLAWPQLGRFSLYAPRDEGQTIAPGAAAVELASVDGAGDSASLAALEFKPGDRLMLVPDEAVWRAGGGAFVPQAVPQVVSVAKVTRTLDRVVLALDKPVVGVWSVPVRAWRLGRSLRHFGHNAPVQLVSTIVSDPGGTITGASAKDTVFGRDLASGVAKAVDPSSVSSLSSSTSGGGFGGGLDPTGARALTDSFDFDFGSAIVWYSPLGPTQIPLDQEVNDLAVGGALILQGRMRIDGAGTVPFVMTRTALEARAGAMQWGNQAGPSTIVTLDGTLVQNSAITGAVLDIRELRVHELKSPALTLRPLLVPSQGEFASGTGALAFFGRAAQAQALAGRRVYLQHAADGRSVELVCTSTSADFAVPAPDVEQCWPLSFDRPPAPFRLEDFGEDAPAVSAFGNIVDASQGRGERGAVLGNGDQRRSFQTFVLPKAPLTYFLAPGAAIAQEAELEVHVGGRLWTRADTFYGHGPDETIYIVREDAEGRSFVQFGDGETGARLPSGLKNVTATYRSGNGARGALKAGTTPTASERPVGFDKVSLLGIVSGGADAEDMACARDAAPGKVQGLGRLVSITDYETEALAVPGVVSAVAGWDLHVGLPVVMLRVLLEAGREAEFTAVQATLMQAQRCAGPDRFALVVEPGALRYAYLDLEYARDPSFAADAVAAGVRAALGLAGETDAARSGVFGLRARRLGAPEHASRIEGRVQNVAGVSWCRVTALGLLAAGLVDPAGVVLPSAPRALARVLGVAPNELLQLADTQLTLTEVATAGTGECAA